jgi:hypothetical protein
MAEAQRRATINLKVQKAQAGQVYASTDAFLPQEKSRPWPDEIWLAQVGLWIQKDLVDAINQTNQQVRQARGISEAPSVNNSAVKRLVSVRYLAYEGATTVAATPGAGPGAAPMVAAERKAGMALAGSLTQRGSNQEYDVVTFQVTMVMNLADWPTFQENLSRQNLYTVLKMDSTAVEQGAGSTMTDYSGGFGGRGGSTATVAEEDLYYYGTDPVVRVTLQIEAILFCDWERPLMPVEML